VFCVGWDLAVSHKHNSNSLAVVLHMNESNVAGNRKRLYTPVIAPNTATHLGCWTLWLCHALFCSYFDWIEAVYSGCIETVAEKRFSRQNTTNDMLCTGSDLPISSIGLSLGPQEPRGRPTNCVTNKVNCRYLISSINIRQKCMS